MVSGGTQKATMVGVSTSAHFRLDTWEAVATEFAGEASSF